MEKMMGFIERVALFCFVWLVLAIIGGWILFAD
jgi:hypothetical protein